MSSDSAMARDCTDRQIAMFKMFVGPGLYTTRAALFAASRIPESTLKSWAAGAAMPLHSVMTLRRFLPAAAINMLTEPGDCRMIAIEASATNWDALTADAAGFVAEVCTARSDGKIDHVEEAKLRQRARVLIAELSDVAETG